MNINQTNRKDKPDEAPADIPQMSPRPIGYGHPEYQFVQSIMEMQKSLGEINASIQTLNKSVDSANKKVDDLVRWKNMILGGAATIGFIIGMIFLFSTKILDHVSFNSAQPKATQQIQPTQK